MLHVGFEIGDQTVESDDRVRVVDLPVVEVASVVHRGSMEDVEPVYETLVRWIEDSGYHLAGRSRELYHEWHDDDAVSNVTEVQMSPSRNDARVGPQALLPVVARQRVTGPRSLAYRAGS